VDLWILGLHLAGLSSISAASTSGHGPEPPRHPHEPDEDAEFCWNVVTRKTIILIATPGLGGRPDHAAHRTPLRHGLLPPAAGGDPVLWQHLLLVLFPPRRVHHGPARDGDGLPGAPRLLDKQLFGYKGMVLATAGIGFIGFMVWGHHISFTGMNPRLRDFFSFASMVIAVPTGIKIWSWLRRPSGAGPSASGPRCSSASALSRSSSSAASTGVWLALVPFDVAGA